MRKWTFIIKRYTLNKYCVGIPVIGSCNLLPRIAFAPCIFGNAYESRLDDRQGVFASATTSVIGGVLTGRLHSRAWWLNGSHVALTCLDEMGEFEAYAVEPFLIVLSSGGPWGRANAFHGEWDSLFTGSII